MNGDDVKAMMEAAARAIIANVDRLSEADRATGDGDHGVGMRRGFEAALEALGGLISPTPEQVMKAVGAAIMSKGGGASGAIFGTLFRSGAKALEGISLWAAMLHSWHTLGEFERCAHIFDLNQKEACHFVSRLAVRAILGERLGTN